MDSRRFLEIPAATVLVLSLALAGTVQADPLRCKATIVKASAAFVQAKAKVVQKCHEAILKGKLPADTNCLAHPHVVATIASVLTKISNTIAKGCGGKDKTCGTADDDPLDAIGWNIGHCPGFEDRGCTNTIADCRDIATCVTCIGEESVDQTIGLYYDTLTPTTQKELNKCQLTIGRASTKFLLAKSAALTNCWDAAFKGTASVCPKPGDGKAADAIAKANSKRIIAICRACGGTDKACGTADDQTRAAIGFPSQCPGTGSCTGSSADLLGIIGCVGCVTDLNVDCVDRCAIPSLATYPVECTPVASTTLDYTKSPIYGSADLGNGFTPDPHTVGFTAGGPVDASYLGGGCSGFATSAPDFRFNYTSGASLLRLYFIGAGDTTMVINDPVGTFHCADNSFATLNPTIDFNNPASGSYDVWIGSHASGTVVAGTLSLTGLAGNHP